MKVVYPIVTILMIIGVTSMLYWSVNEVSDNYLFIGLSFIGLGIMGIGIEFYYALFVDSEVNEEFV